jgi:uncharacterized protein
MATGMAKDHMNYSQLVETALKGVVESALRRAAESHLPGNHHFYISFRTDHAGTRISPVLKAQYPQEMTIVLQHQYWDLSVTPDGFEVTLSFNKVNERLSVPFSALTGFYDPSVQFGLQFKGAEAAGAPAQPPAPVPAASPPAPAETPTAPASAPESEAEKIVSLDRFRKK